MPRLSEVHERLKGVSKRHRHSSFSAREAVRASLPEDAATGQGTDSAGEAPVGGQPGCSGCEGLLRPDEWGGGSDWRLLRVIP